MIHSYYHGTRYTVVYRSTATPLMLLAHPLHASATPALEDLCTLSPRATMDDKCARKLYGLLDMQTSAASGAIMRLKKERLSSLPRILFLPSSLVLFDYNTRQCAYMKH